MRENKSKEKNNGSAGLWAVQMRAESGPGLGAPDRASLRRTERCCGPTAVIA